MRNVRIGNFILGEEHPTHIIAEIGGNFTDFEGAKRLIDLALDAGADSVKLQTYRAETISSRKAIYDMPNVGRGASQFDLFKAYEVDFSLHREIWDYCRARGVLVFSTPSHMNDVELLEKLDCEVYKIGSDDACNIPFLRDVAAIGKPIILSTGMCTMHEVRESVSAILGTGNPDLVLLQCVTNYPSDPAHANLRAIEAMKREFALPIGYSDHTTNNYACFAAAALGACAVEKHFTHDKNAKGPDHMLSADPADLRALVEGIRTIEAALGDGVKRPSEGERKTRVNNRKSLVALGGIKAGTVITHDMVAIKRPGYGIPPKYRDEVIGRIARVDIEAEVPITWDDV